MATTGSTVNDALNVARSLLNDDLGVRWTDSMLLPKVSIAHLELQSAMRLHSIPAVVTQDGSPFVVTAGTKTILSGGATYPADMIAPIALKERAVGEREDEYVDMIETRFLPTLEPDSRLVYWAWLDGVIRLIGATEDREVLIRYTKKITTPRRVHDDLGLAGAELFVGARVAALIDPTHSDTASTALHSLLGTGVKRMQGVMRRRLPYRHVGWRKRGL